MQSADIVSHVLKTLVEHTRPGIRTLTLNNLAEAEIEKMGAIPYNKGYKPAWAKTRFPASVCISVNNEIAHGIPGPYLLREGDLISFDVGIKKDGVCADAALTVGVGSISPKNRDLLKAAKEVLYAGIETIKPGITVRSMAISMDSMAKKHGFVINRSFSGHAIGEEMHMEPYIYHTENWLFNNKTAYIEYDKFMSVEFKQGMILCLEPIVTTWDRFGILAKDGWTWITRDGNNSAIFEHMIKVTKHGCEVLTSHITR